MKIKIMLLVLVMAVSLAACQTKATITPLPNGVYPGPGTAYPGPKLPVNSIGTIPSAYPSSSDIWTGPETRLAWEEAIKPVLNGDALALFQNPDTTDVVIYLKNGSRILTAIAAEGDVSKLIQQCGDACKELKHIP